MCVGIGDFPVTRPVPYTSVVKGISWNWRWGTELYWCVIPNRIWFSEIVLLIKGTWGGGGGGLVWVMGGWVGGGGVVWVITTRVFPHRHDCGQWVVSPRVYKPVHLRIKSVLSSDLATPSLVSLHICLVVALHHGPPTRYEKLRVAHAPGKPGSFSPPPTSKETTC